MKHDAATTFPRIACIYGANLTPQATDIELRLLSRYDLLIGGLPYWFHSPDERPQLNANIRRLRDLNPGITILDFPIAAPYWPLPLSPTPPEEAFLHTVDGQRVNGWPSTQMLNLAREEAIDFLIERVSERVDALDVDGFFIDCMFSHFDAWAVEIETHNPVKIDADGDRVEDSKADLDAAWTAGKLRLMERLRARYGDSMMMMINAQRAGDYAKPWVNGNYLEDYIDLAITQNGDWNDILRLYLDWCSVPTAPNCTTINATPSYWPEYEAPLRLPYDECNDILQNGYAQLQAMRFGLATALMGDGYYGFDLNTRWRGQHWWYAEFDAPLGEARGLGSRQDDGTWRREFENGIAIVNPLPRRVHIKLERSFRDYTTGWTGREFVIPARDGRIYFPVAPWPLIG